MHLRPPPLLPTDFVAIAAYDDGEPQSAGSISYRPRTTPGKDYPQQYEDLSYRLPFSCDGRSFQRLVLSSCDSDENTLREWAALTGLPIAEQYYGPLGNVIVLDFPPGMDINTGGDGARTQRARINTGNGTAEPDYLVNLFDTENPSRTDGEIRTVDNDPEVAQADLKPSYFDELAPPFNPNTTFDPTRKPLRVAIIDSGVDTGQDNGRLWDAYRYSGGSSEYIRGKLLGFDFIAKDLTPDDHTPHGTFVAAALINNYAGSSPLELIHLRTFGEEGISSYFGALVSLYEAAVVRSDIINMSWGIQLDKAPEALECAVDRVVGTGAYLVTSAGNSRVDLSDRPQWPASFGEQYPEQMLTVASFWYGGRGLDPKRDPDFVVRRNFSNFGKPSTGRSGVHDHARAGLRNARGALSTRHLHFRAHHYGCPGRRAV